MLSVLTYTAPQGRPRRAALAAFDAAAGRRALAGWGSQGSSSLADDLQRGVLRDTGAGIAAFHVKADVRGRVCH
jgi:hypothetical protein